MAPQNRTTAIGTFLSGVRGAVNPAGGLLGADVFGYVCWREDDMGIGQNLEAMAPALDAIHF